MVGESAAAIMARSTSKRRGRPGVLFACAGAVAVLSGLVAVFAGVRTDVPTKAPQIARVTAGSTPEATAARGAVAAYRGYQRAFALAGAHPDSSDDARLKEYAGDPALIQTQISLNLLAQSGLAYRGEFKDQVAVTSVSLATNMVSLLSCQDISGFSVISLATGKPVSKSSQSVRYLVVAHARLFEGRWIIVDATADRGRRC